MKHQEKKYRVDSFTKIRKELTKLGAHGQPPSTTIHYYARQAGNDITKVVKYHNGVEIHRLQESSGKFLLVKRVAVDSVRQGMKWLRNEGFHEADIVKMVSADYEYEDGIVGLYIINDFINSVILDFPDRNSGEVERHLGLGAAEVISVPYNKYLDRLGRARTIKLS